MTVPPGEFDFGSYDCVAQLPEYRLRLPRHIEAAIASRLGGRVLDIGSGDGRKLRTLLDLASVGAVSEVCCVEPSRVLQPVLATQVPAARLIGEDLFDLDVDACGEFDCVMCLEVIEHTTRQDELLATIARLTAPSGVAIISTPNRPVYRAFVWLLRGRGGDPTHVAELSCREFRALCEQWFDVTSYCGTLPLTSIFGRNRVFQALNGWLNPLRSSQGVTCFARQPHARRESAQTATPCGEH